MARPYSILKPWYFSSIMDAYRVGLIFSQMAPTRKFFIFKNGIGFTLVPNRFFLPESYRLGFYLSGSWHVDS